MPFAPILRRGACAALALVVLVSSLTCMTVACRLACAGSAGTAAKADLPPCHRAAGGAGAHHDGTTPGPDGCGAGVVCCSTWLHDDQAIHLADPRLLRAAGPVADPAAAPGPLALGDPDVPFSCDVGKDAPRPQLATHLDSRSTRGPPRTHPAA